MAKGFNRGGGMPSNMANLMKQAQKMQEDLTKTQENLEKESYGATAGGGAVSCTISGTGKITELKISEDVLDDAEMVADLVMAAVNEAVSEMLKKKDSEIGSLTGGLGNFGGLF